MCHNKSMACKLIILVLTCVLTVPILAACGGESKEPTTTLLPIPTETLTPVGTSQAIQGFDSHITVVLNRIESANLLPSDIVKGFQLTPHDKSPTPTEGDDFVCLYLTVTRIENVHVDALDCSGDLLNDQGNEYNIVTSGVLNNLRSVGTDNIELLEGASIFLVFEAPKNERPAQLRFVYSFKETWEDKTAKRGQVDIVL